MRFASHLALVAALALPLLAAQPGADASAVTATTLLKTATTWNGAPIVYPRTDKPEIQTVVVEIPSGAATAWHLHPVNNIAYILEGKLRLELKDGTTREFRQGESFAELVNTTHRGVNIGKGPLRILVVYLGEAGAPISVHQDRQGE